MTTIVFVLKMLILTSAPSLTVDRVESDYAPVAVVCSSDMCVNVRTTLGKGGLREGQSINACETFKRGDGTQAVVCGGSVRFFIGVDGTRHANPYAYTQDDSDTSTYDNDCAVY